jgi:NADPH-dependent F420 reductase
MVSPMRIGILGGTGPAGRALAARLADNGYPSVIGSRSVERAEEARQKLLDRWPDRNLDVTAGDNEAAAACDVVVVATPWDAAAVTVRSVRELLAGKVVISMANALARIGDEFQPLVSPRGSVAAAVQAAVPDSQVAAAFQHVPAKELGDLDEPIVSDVLICSDHPNAASLTAEIVGKLPNMRPLEAGELSNATAIEAFVAVMLQLNVRYKTRVALKLEGLEGVEGIG